MGATRLARPRPTVIAFLRHRYRRFTACMLAPLLEVEREEVRAFDRWFYRHGGWRWIVYLAAGATLAAWGASRLAPELSFAKTALLLNVVVFMLAWACLSAWFGYRKFQGKALRSTLVTLVFVPLGAAVCGTAADLYAGRAPFDWFVHDTAIRTIVIVALVFGLLYAATVAVVATLRSSPT